MLRSLVKCRRSLHSTRQFSASVDKEDVSRFNKLAKNWWDVNGEFSLLHSLNKLRVPFIRDGLKKRPESPLHLPLQNLKLLDVGCGGGILSEPLSKLGAKVTGLDAGSENIEAAKYHASLNTSFGKEQLTYINDSIENFLTAEGHKNVRKFDGVILSEIVEHVLDVENFLNASCSLVKPGGSLFITTINKTWLSYWLAIVAAEKVLKLVPEGMHDWDKFISPQDIQSVLKKNNFEVRMVHGMTLNPFTMEWWWCENDSVNYVLHAVNYSTESNIA